MSTVHFRSHTRQYFISFFLFFSFRKGYTPCSLFAQKVAENLTILRASQESPPPIKKRHSRALASLLYPSSTLYSSSPLHADKPYQSMCGSQWGQVIAVGRHQRAPSLGDHRHALHMRQQTALTVLQRLRLILCACVTLLPSSLDNNDNKESRGANFPKALFAIQKCNMQCVTDTDFVFVCSASHQNEVSLTPPASAFGSINNRQKHRLVQKMERQSCVVQLTFLAAQNHGSVGYARTFLLPPRTHPPAKKTYCLVTEVFCCRYYSRF